jgi:uncharacterized protein (TIGR02444 family)
VGLVSIKRRVYCRVIMTPDLPENPFWKYSLSVYVDSEVASVCMELQDKFHFDVNFLLYACWLGSNSYQLTTAHLQELEEAVSTWRDRVIHPLRGLRGELPKDGVGGKLRARILDIELTTERRQQDLMYSCWARQAFPVVEGSHVLSNLQAIAAFFAVDIQAVKPLFARLDELLYA